jgi:chemotaxis signal transduction protein
VSEPWSRLELVLFALAGEWYALELDRVRQVAREGALSIPLVDLRERLGAPPTREPGRLIVTTNPRGGEIALRVDAVLEVRTVESRVLRPPPTLFRAGSAAVRALVPLPDEEGRFAMLLAPDQLFTGEELAELAELARQAERTQAESMNEEPDTGSGE